MKREVTGFIEEVAQGFSPRRHYELVDINYPTFPLEVALEEFKGKQVRITIEPCEFMRIEYNGKRYGIRKYDDLIEIVHSEGDGTYRQWSIVLSDWDKEQRTWFEDARMAFTEMASVLERAV